SREFLLVRDDHGADAFVGEDLQQDGVLDPSVSQAALIGAGAAVCAVIGHRVAAYDYPSRFVHMTAGVALPLTAAVPAVYLLGRVVTG
ncbi:hypothetical protein ABZ663_31930, partial [Streptomyces albidoflavus]